MIGDRLPLTESNPIASAPNAANSASADEFGFFDSPFSNHRLHFSTKSRTEQRQV